MTGKLKALVRHIPGIQSIYIWYSKIRFRGSRPYWESRYARGGNSGAGSYQRLAIFKAEILNSFVQTHDIQSIIEFGCGDGNQLSLADYPKYLGVDISSTALKLCVDRFHDDPKKTFGLYDDFSDRNENNKQTAELTLSLDVIYHLVEDDIFEMHMKNLFEFATRFVIVYSSNHGGGATAGHVRHRNFTNWVLENASSWQLETKIDNKYPHDPDDPDETSFADFYVFERKQT